MNNLLNTIRGFIHSINFSLVSAVLGWLQHCWWDVEQGLPLSSIVSYVGYILTALHCSKELRLYSYFLRTQNLFENLKIYITSIFEVWKCMKYVYIEKYSEQIWKFRSFQAMLTHLWISPLWVAHMFQFTY